MKNTRRWCKALAGLWARRASPVVSDIVSEALEEAEHYMERHRPANAPQWFAQLDPRTLRTIRVSPAALEYLGMKEEQVVGLNPSSYLLAENLPGMREAVTEAVTTGYTSQVFLKDRHGGLAVIYIEPVEINGQTQLSVFAYRPTHRLFQLVGEPA